MLDAFAFNDRPPQHTIFLTPQMFSQLNSYRKCATGDSRGASSGGFFVHVEFLCATLVAFATSLHVMQHVMRPLIFRMKNQRPNFLSARLYFFRRRFQLTFFIPVWDMRNGDATRTRKLVAGAFQQRTNTCSYIIKRQTCRFGTPHTNFIATIQMLDVRECIVRGAWRQQAARKATHANFHLWIVFVPTRTDDGNIELFALVECQC